MQSYQHVTPPLRLYSGPDSLGQLGRELERLKASRALVVCGPWAEGPLLDAVLGAAAGRCAGVFTGVLAHSPLASVQEAAADITRLKVDAVIALGGGLPSSRRAPAPSSPPSNVTSASCARHGSPTGV